MATELQHLDNWSHKLESPRGTFSWEEIFARDPPKVNFRCAHRYDPEPSRRPFGKEDQIRRRVAEDSDDEPRTIKKSTYLKSSNLPKTNQHIQFRSQKDKPSKSQTQHKQTVQSKCIPIEKETAESQAPQDQPAPQPTKPSRSAVKRRTSSAPYSWEFAHLGQLAAANNNAVNRTRASSKKHRLRQVAVREQRSPLLNRLPGEIRNRIYEFIISETRVLICRNRPFRERAEAQRAWENQDKYVKMPRSRLYCMIDNYQIRAGFEMTSGLLLTCKQIQAEVQNFMYSRITFCFESPKIFDMFVKVAPKEGIEAITSIEIRHEGYGEPRMTEHTYLKDQHDVKWQTVYERINKELISLTKLRLEVRLHDWPIRLSLKEAWCQELMCLVKKKPLFAVRAHLKHRQFKEPRLIEVARRLENNMMSEEGQLARDKQETMLVLREIQAKKQAEMARRALLPPQQASKVLRVRIDDYKVAPARPVQATKEYTTSAVNWRWRYGDGNVLGPDPNCVQLY